METQSTERKLAIIIPYYKNDFINEALESIQNQTNRNFKLYIGDDASPNHINQFIEQLDDDFKKLIVYNRFEQNLGSISLTKQWQRCIELSKDEKYIWLFSDDDVMPKDAVQRFYDSIKNSETTDVIRFNVCIIDNTGKLIGSYKPHPEIESAESFARRRLLGQCVSTACEYIFTKKIFIEKNGFIEFPLAWSSDDATWINFSGKNNIVTIPGECVMWRMSGLNISSDSEKSYKKKFEASILYIRFLRGKFNFKKAEELDWLISQLNLLGNSLALKKEFNTQLLESRLFTENFINSHLFKRKIKHYLSRLTTIFKQ